MNFRDLVEKVREHDQHEPYDCDCLLCRLFRDLYETNYTIFFSPDVSRMNQEAYDAGKTAASADLAAADLAKAREEGRREAIKQLLVLGADGLGVYYDTGDRIVVDRRTYLIDADVFDALLGEKEEK